jgi:hypothetical protein
MFRTLSVFGIAMGFVVLISAGPAPKQPPSMIQKLNRQVDFTGIEDARATLSDALDQISKQYDLSFEINDSAFKVEMIPEVDKLEVAQRPIPAMKKAKIDRVLRKVLSRVSPHTQSGATYLVRGDHIEITTTAFQKTEIWGSYRGPFLPLLNIAFDKMPLTDAVRELAEQAEFNVVVDPRAAEKAKTPVSARLFNTPFDSALRLLCDMSDLQTVQIDNVFYVTTKENASALEARLESEKRSVDSNALQEEMPAPAGWRKGSGRMFLIPAPN